MLDYFTELLDTHCWSAVKLDLYGLKFFYARVLKKPWEDSPLIKPPKTSRIPDILTVEQTGQLFAATRILSYKVFFFACYRMGLRLGEGIRLRVGDIDADNMRVHIRDAKGNKDRLVPLPDKTLRVLREFWAVHKHPRFLFPSRKRGLKNAHLVHLPLDRGGIQTAMQSVVRQLGIKKLGGSPGFTAILHTHSRTLDYHPHIHVVIPAASIDLKTGLWKQKSGKYLFSHKALAKVFRAKLLQPLVENNLPVPHDCPTQWVVDCEDAGNDEKALIYLGRYLYRGVIREQDIVQCRDGMVTFRYRHAKSGEDRTRTVKREYFLYLLMLPVLPRGFRRARSYQQEKPEALPVNRSGHHCCQPPACAGTG